MAHLYELGSAKNENDEMHEMSLPSGHVMLNPSAGGLRPSTLSVTDPPHNTESLRVSGEETFSFL